MRICLAALAGALLLFGIPAHADALQDQLVAAAKATRSDIYSFRRTTLAETVGQDKRTVVEQFDPRRPAADQWTIVSIDGKPPTAKEIKDARKSRRGPVPSYGNIAEWLGGAAVRSDGPEGYVTYRYARLPKGTLMLGSHDASPDTQADVLVNMKGSRPFVERITLRSNRKFSMMLVASVHSIAITSRFRQLADGSPVIDVTTSDIAGSMMGKTGSIRSNTTFSDFQRVR